MNLVPLRWRHTVQTPGGSLGSHYSASRSPGKRLSLMVRGQESSHSPKIRRAAQPVGGGWWRRRWSPRCVQPHPATLAGIELPRTRRAARPHGSGSLTGRSHRDFTWGRAGALLAARAGVRLVGASVTTVRAGLAIVHAGCEARCWRGWRSRSAGGMGAVAVLLLIASLFPPVAPSICAPERHPLSGPGTRTLSGLIATT